MQVIQLAFCLGVCRIGGCGIKQIHRTDQVGVACILHRRLRSRGIGVPGIQRGLGRLDVGIVLSQHIAGHPDQAGRRIGLGGKIPWMLWP